MDKIPNINTSNSPVSPVLDSPSSEDFDDNNLCLDAQELSDLEDISGQIETNRKPHFLDYDYYLDEGGNSSEKIKVDKRLERDGEVSDHIACAGKTSKEEGLKKKHFLDENPVPPPEYMIKQDISVRKHRSLDRNFDRAKETTTDNYSLNRFLEREVNPETLRGTWPTTDNSDTNVLNPKSLANMPSAALDLGPKVECVYSLLNMLGQNDPADMASKFFELSKNRETCMALRRSGCISILVQLLHSDSDEIIRKKASAALHNVVYCHIDDKTGRREVRVLKLIEQLLDYCEFLRKVLSNGESVADHSEQHPIVPIGTLMKTSFDEDHRHAMCTLGALQTISTLVQLDHEIHGAKSEDQNCITLRRYAGMTLTNLTFGDGNNKALLCSNKSFMKSLVMQIESNSDELVQVTASVLRNLSWRADTNMKQVLKEIGAVKILTKAAMNCTQENTLKSILSALWNLSNHCSTNKAEFCECDGAIDFLIDMLNYDAPSKTMAVIENAGGILRNISSHIATKEEYRQILRRRQCLGILLQQLKSSSLTVVSNASGTLGNLSANCVEDQKFLRDNGAIPMLRSLIYSKHKMISTGSTIALKNLLNYQKTGLPGQNLDSVSRSMDLKELPTLNVRKQRALEQELDQNLSHNCENDDVTTPPKEDHSKYTANIGTQARNLMSQFVKSQNKMKNCDSKMKSNNSQSTSHNSAETEEKEEGFDQVVNFSKQSSEEVKSTIYQETDLDQPVNFSIRYAENVTDSEEDRSSPFEQRQILMEEDCVRTYFTEGTPKVTSNSGSITDLRHVGLKDKPSNSSQIKPSKSVQLKQSDAKPTKNITPILNSGLMTPEKPVNYCEEGTPGDFSRCDSLSDLGEQLEPQSPATQQQKVEIQNPVSEKQETHAVTPKTVKFSNVSDGTPLETPLMYSRHSSAESLESAGSVCVADDKSSVVSDFSRLASGIISPSELPDSPTQSIPHSPRQRSQFVRADTHETTSNTHVTTALKSDVFEDQTNAFGVENTPAQFSCATSLSNLSLDDEPKITKDCLVKEMQLMSHPSEEKEDVIDEENLDDNYLLEQAINMGIQSSTTRQPGVGASCNNSDTIKEYCTEDTPAPLSKVGSNSNLSALSIATGMDIQKSEEMSSNASDIDDQLLEAAINDGIVKKSTVKQNDFEENPLERLRRGVIPSYLPVGDETSHFGIEGSPKTFSVASELSGITVGSEVIGLAKLKRSREHQSKPVQQGADRQLYSQAFDDSLSSLSIDSTEDETNVLNQAIAVGARTLISNHNQYRQDPNESYSSMESCDDSQNKSLLEQAVQSGMQKGVKKKQTSQMSNSKSQKQNTSYQNDEMLLEEAINTGIKKTTGQSLKTESQALNIPKNVKSSTSVVVSESVTITNMGVEKLSMKLTTKERDINGYENAVFQHQHLQQQQQRQVEPNHQLNGSKMSNSTTSVHSLMYRSNEYPALKMSTYEFAENSCADSFMEMSNEFMTDKDTLDNTNALSDKHKDPDLMLRSVDRLTQQLVSTAEFLRQTDPNCLRTIRERKNSFSAHTWNEDSASFPSISVDAPNMIGSVNDEENTFNDIQSTSCQDNKRNEDKTSLNENNEIVDEVQCLSLKDTSLDGNEFKSIDTVRDISDTGIHFKLGGEVNHPITSTTFTSSGPMSIDSCSTMTNSTIICMEANKVAADLQNYSPTDSLNSLDLDNIRPPSVMDCVSLSTVTYDAPITYSPQLPRSRKKSLPSGIMARRALGQLGTRGSVESVNSLGHTNLDNIKPPSIMDELLDSMISVASITSEVADNNTMPQLMQSSSHYETALSEIDDTTLQSCMDLPNENDATPIQSDFSSNESTPRKGESKRSLTPKQKRQASDRYLTYTISSNNDRDIKRQDDEMLQIEISDHERKRLTPREKRNGDRERFETQVLDSATLQMIPRSGNNSPSKRRSENPDRFKTRTLSQNEQLHTVLREANVIIETLQNQNTDEPFLLDEATSDCISLVSNDDVTEDLSIKAATAHLQYIQNFNSISKHEKTKIQIIRQLDDGSDFTSFEYEQNSETESCEQNRLSDNSVDEANIHRLHMVNRSNELYLDSAGDEGSSSPEPKGIRGRKKPAYVSPYRRTSLNKYDNTSSKPSMNKQVPKKKITNSSLIKAPSNDLKKQTVVARANLGNKIKTSNKPINEIPTGSNVICKSKTYTEISSHSSQMPDRQGTFIKEEGTDLNVPVVTSAPATPSKQNKFMSKIPSKTGSVTKNFVSKMRIPLYRSGSTPDPDSSKNQKISINKSTSVPSVPAGQRSNSNTSLKTPLSATKSAINVSGPVTAPKRDITSKIAGIWKKIDESKKQQTSKKDNRVWIGSKQKTNANMVSSKPPAAPQLIRSSTFDASPEQGSKKMLPNITKGKPLKSPSSGNLKGFVSNSRTERRTSLLTNTFNRM